MINKSIVFCCLCTFIWAETITLTPIDIHETVLSSGTVVLSEEEALETNSITLQERLENDVSFSVVVDRKGEAAISFRGLDFKSTAYVEDGIPLYRNANGFTDTKFTMTRAALELNDGSGTSFFGVSPMGGEVQITSKNPSKTFESQLDSTFSNNDEYYHAYVKVDASYYYRSEYELSDDYEPTLIQGKGSRVNSDKDQKNFALKSGIFLDDQIHLAAKVSVTRSEYGMPPNVHTDLQAPVWDAYSRIDKKDLNSYYLYGDYISDDLELSVRAYYDDYEDIYRIYDDPAYYYDVDDLILYRDNGYINRNNAENYGAEIRISSSYFDKHALRFSYAYPHTRDSEGEDLELIPLHQMKIEDTLRLSAKLKAYLGYQYVGSRYSANTAPTVMNR